MQDFQFTGKVVVTYVNTLFWWKFSYLSLDEPPQYKYTHDIQKLNCKLIPNFFPKEKETTYCRFYSSIYVRTYLIKVIIISYIRRYKFYSLSPCNGVEEGFTNTCMLRLGATERSAKVMVFPFSLILIITKNKARYRTIIPSKTPRSTHLE